MRLEQLAGQYRITASVFRERIKILTARLKTEDLCEMDKLRLRARISTLMSIYRDLGETAVVLERYYDRGFSGHGRFSI